MNIKKFVDKLKIKKKEEKVIEELITIPIEKDNPFVFKYNSICPALSIICLNKNVLNTPKRFEWLSELCILFNKSMNTDIYVIDKIDLLNPNQWFNKMFGHDSLKNATEISNNPLLWGKYIWSLLHIISLFWTVENNEHIVYLLENVNYILPCLDCQKHYIELIKDHKYELNNIKTLSSSANFVINVREIISNNAKKYNRVPDDTNHSFVEIYNYILPLVEPDDSIKLKTNRNRKIKKCNCSKYKK